VDYLFYLFILCAFLAVVLLFEGGFMMWNSYKGPEAKQMDQRLRALSAGEHGDAGLVLLKERNLSQMPAMERLLLFVPRVHQLDRLLIQSGSSWTVARFFATSAVFGFAGFAVPAVLRLSGWLPLALGALGALLPLYYILRRRSQRLNKLDEQLPEALDLISRAMRAGHAFPSALQMVAEESQNPTGSEFRITFEEVNYGIAVKDALLNLATRVPSADLRYFVIAVLIQRETGGNLAELLGNISALIRARFKLLGTIRVLAAEGKLSAWILTLLPVCTALFINLVNPGFMEILWTDETGLKMLKATLALMAFGIFWMWRLVKIRV